MKKIFVFLVLVLALTACQRSVSNLPQPTANVNLLYTAAAATVKVMATPTPAQTATLAPSATLISATPTAKASPTTVAVLPTNPVPVVSWSLPDPLDPVELPNNLPDGILYVEPPVRCAETGNLYQSCTYKEGQAVSGEFGLDPGMGFAATGDDIMFSYKKGGLLVDVLKKGTHTLWVIINPTSQQIKLGYNAPYGSWTGFFKLASGNWTNELIAGLRDQTIRNFLLPTQPLATPVPAGPTPVWNCGNSSGCPSSNVYVLIAEVKNSAIGWFHFDGIYDTGKSPHWKK